jgi:hypothetical protein
MYILWVCIVIDSLPFWSCIPAGKNFPGIEPPGEDWYTASQGLIIRPWAPDTLFLCQVRCWGQYLQVNIPRNAKMRTYFVFSYIYAIYFDVWRFSGSNKRWILFIYTPKHVLIVLEYFPIKGAKMRICFWPSPAQGWPCRVYWEKPIIHAASVRTDSAQSSRGNTANVFKYLPVRTDSANVAWVNVL